VPHNGYQIFADATFLHEFGIDLLNATQNPLFTAGFLHTQSIYTYMYQITYLPVKENLDYLRQEVYTSDE
jgi:hypothetical protein